MRYRRLGNTGLQVSEVSLGGNVFGGYTTEDQAFEIINRALDLGVNHIDSADIYAKTLSEQYIGKAIAKRRGDVVFATKVGMPAGSGPNEVGLSYRRVIAACEASLRRIGTDYIDLYYLHRPDPLTPIEETFRALDDLVRQGKIRYIGVSNFAAWQISDAIWIADKRNYAPPVVTQSKYNLLDRAIEFDIVPFCQEHDFGIIPFFPLASGLLTGKYKPDEAIQPGVRGYNNPNFERQLTDRNWRLVDALSSFATEQGHSISELAIAWLLTRPQVSSVIVGSTKVHQMEANVAAGDWKLSSNEQDAVAAILNQADA